MPQVPPGRHAAPVAGAAADDDPREAKVESFLWTWLLPQLGQTMSESRVLLRTSFSNGSSQSSQTNSNKGMVNSPSVFGLHVPAVHRRHLPAV